MKSIIVFNLLAITAINPIIKSHENHDHQIYSWQNSRNKSKKTDNNVNSKKFKDKRNNAKTYKKNSLKLLEEKSNS